MKKTFLIIIIFIILGGITEKMVCASEVRSIKIKVVDKETLSPIKGVVIYYQLETAGFEKILGFIPKIDPVEYRYPLTEEYSTDADGTIIIPERKIHLELYEKLYSEKICLNLEIKNEFIEGNNKKGSFFRFFNIHDFKNVEKFYNPIEFYKGFVIYNFKDDLDSNTQGGTKRQKFNILWNGRSFEKKEESFTIELEKKE
jgi:hypothetical protein